MTYVIREIPTESRPRERLLAHGPGILSDAELLAIIIGTGVPGKNALHLAQELLLKGMHNLRDRDLATLSRTRGIGPAKAARIAAAMEMARRLGIEPKEQPPKYDSAVVGRELVRSAGHLLQERLGAVLLDARHRVLTRRELFVGTIDKAIVSTSDIVRFALLERAKGVVIYHNHPSGDPSPSPDDVIFTGQLKQSLAMVDLDLVDHLIVCEHRYYSLGDRGQL